MVEGRGKVTGTGTRAIIRTIMRSKNRFIIRKREFPRRVIDSIDVASIVKSTARVESAEGNTKREMKIISWRRAANFMDVAAMMVRTGRTGTATGTTTLRAP